MARTQFRIAGATLDPYPTMLFFGMVAGVVAGTQFAESRGLVAGRAYVAMLALLAPAVIGSRLLFVVCNWPVFRHDLRRIFRRSDGGMALFGGLFLVLGLSVPLLALLRLPFAAFWDAGAVVILVGMAFTKVGCHVNGCCAGRVTTHVFGWRLPNEYGVWARRIPSQLLESVLALVLLAVAIPASARFRFDGALFLCAALGYGLGRCWLESTRESEMRLGDLRVSRAIAASLAVISAIILAVA